MKRSEWIVLLIVIGAVWYFFTYTQTGANLIASTEAR